ncbi:MAG TPA: sigma-54 dependent transcriptional regulator [Nitrospiraceae bacterium]
MSSVVSNPVARKRGERAPFTILVVEDDASDTELALHALERAELKAIEGEIQIEVRSTAEGALSLLRERSVDLVLTDMMLPGMDGLDLVSRIQEIERDLPVLIMTRVSSVQSAVDAMRRGAYDYVLKPLSPADLGMRLHKAIRVSEILRRHASLERIIHQIWQGDSLIGSSAPFQQVLRQIREAAQVRSTVLVTGETGTGKGLIARAIHEHSRERDKPYQVIDCTTFPEGMVETELFGHVRGAFTGAIADKPGLIELANGGTVFLDEIGDLPMPLQAKLLRVLEDSEVRPVGGTRTKRVDMRFIAATNQNLQEKIKNGSFRKDLYYRLAVVTIPVPPLRERIEDVPAIAGHLLEQFGREMGKRRCYLDPSATAELTTYPWPGNVRELRNVVERVVMLATSDVITKADIKSLLTTPQDAAADSVVSYAGLPYMDAKEKALADFTGAYLKAKLAMYDGHITKAAEASEIPRQHFSLLMKRYLGREESENS